MSSPVLVKNRLGRTHRWFMPATVRRHPAILGHALSAIRRALHAFVEDVVEMRRTARACRELTAMSDPELRDIGIGRSDIPAVMSGLYRRTLRPTSDRSSCSRRQRSPSPERSSQLCDQGVSP